MNSILYTKEGNVGYITLNRPEKYNSVNRSMALLLQETLDKCGSDADIRAVYITGSGKAFGAGQDLDEIVDPNGPDITKIIGEHYNPIIERIRKLQKPVVAAINGVAAGAAANIALACDVVVATESASFIQAFSKIGLIPDSGGTYHLPRIIGFQKASALMMLGEKVSATEAERIGMIYKVIPDADFEAESKKLVVQLSQMPTTGLAFTKQALNATWSNSLTQQLELEGELQYKANLTNDYKEGVQAFLEKRRPIFKGN